MMTKNLHLLFSFVFLSFFASAQENTPPNTCGTGAPPQQWEDWFQSKIEEYKQQKQHSKQQQVNVVIPVIVHVIHFGEALGTYPNIDSNQIKTQINVLNADFAGTGFNSNKVPSYFAPVKANTGISFCRARFDQLDVALIEPGIHRVDATGFNWQSPSTPTLDLQNYFNTVIMPGTIWDPQKYFNIWVSDKPLNYPLNGFATYPGGTTLNGMWGGPVGTSGNDGIWVYAKAFGTINTTAPYNFGRTATHETGHWLGLRHMWGDGNCLSDYVSDTPYHKHANYGCDTLPTRKDTCGPNTAPNGEMRMNFMDRSNDRCMYMFTTEQAVRMQTALSQSPNRNQLGTHSKCVLSASGTTYAAVANFTAVPKQCLKEYFTLYNTSTGFPNPTYIWSSVPAAPFFPNNTVPHPALNLTNPGNYTVTLIATNSLSSSSYSMVISATQTCAAKPGCIDSIRPMKNVDTLRTYRAQNSTFPGCQTGFAGYLTGTNCYKDREYAQFFGPNSYSHIPFPQVNSCIILFDSAGTRAKNLTTPVSCKIYGGTSAQGPVTLIDFKSVPISTIINTPRVFSVSYLGKPNQPPIGNTRIIPYKFDFNSPVSGINPVSGFYVSVDVPQNSLDDSINVYSTTKYNKALDSSVWFLPFNAPWKNMKNNRGMKVQLAMMPQLTCRPVGVNEITSVLASNVNVMPNPNSGLFNVVFTFKTEQELRMRIISSIGQEVLNSKLEHVLNNVISVDLSEYPDGIYFAEISNGSEKVVKKIVLTR